MMMREDLANVRHELDSLNIQRLLGPFTSDKEKTYRALCRRERVLLEEMVTSGDSR
jgi:hypothetical protein